MSFQAKVVEDWKVALKNKDPRKDALSMIITELKNRAIKENVGGGEGRVVSDAVAMEVLQKMAKQRKESIDAFMAANRPELAEKERVELAVVEAYLPKSLTDEELTVIVQKAITEVGATSMKEMGKVMGVAIKACGGRADGKRIQSIVESLLKNA
jgi:uncharacterized protein YqeY